MTDPSIAPSSPRKNKPMKRPKKGQKPAPSSASSGQKQQSKVDATPIVTPEDGAATEKREKRKAEDANVGDDGQKPSKKARKEKSSVAIASDTIAAPPTAEKAPKSGEKMTETQAKLEKGKKPERGSGKGSKKAGQISNVTGGEGRKDTAPGGSNDISAQPGVKPLSNRKMRKSPRSIRKAARAAKEAEAAANAPPVPVQDQPNPAQQKQALAYLRAFVKHRSEWKFQKPRQNWILKKMYSAEDIPDKEFKKYLLKYVAGLRGASRQRTLEGARRVAGGRPEDPDEDEEAGGEASGGMQAGAKGNEKEKVRRARAQKILKALEKGEKVEG